MDKKRQLKFADNAPDVELMDTKGKSVLLSSLWSHGTLLLAFTRHYGCPQCKEMLHRLSLFQPSLNVHRMQIAVVTQGTVDETRAFCGTYAAELICLSDKDQKAYRQYGIKRPSYIKMLLTYRVWRENRRVQAEKGWKSELPPPGQDARFMSALFIIGKDGMIRLPYYYDDIADHPPLELLVKGFAGTDWDTPINGSVVGHTEESHVD